MRVLLFLFFIGLSWRFTSADSTFTFIHQGRTQRIPWEIRGFAPQDSLIGPASALFGKTGIRLREHPYRSDLSGRAPMLKDFWERFYFRANGTAEAGARSMDFLSFNLSGRFTQPWPAHVLIFSLGSGPDPGLFELIALAYSGGKSNPAIRKTLPIRSGQIHCAEFHIVLVGPDSLDVTLFLDGDSILSGRHAWYNDKTRIFNFFKTNPDRKVFGPQGSLDIDEMVVSDRRPVPLVPAPKGLRAVLGDREVRLLCDSSGISYANNRFIATQWIVRRANEPWHLYDKTDINPRFFFNRPVPFSLDSGRYLFQARHQASSGAWSEFCAPESLSVARQRPWPLKIEDSWITDLENKPVRGPLLTGRDYRLGMALQLRNGWGSLSYIIAQFGAMGFNTGHPGNKGGYFIPESNYVFNLSSSEEFIRGGPIRIYEKMERSFESRRVVTNDVPGRYITGGKEDIVCDTVSGRLSLRFQLMPRAVPGPWVLTVYGLDSTETLSNTLRKTFIVKNADPRIRVSRRMIAALFILVIASAVLSVVRRRRRAMKTFPSPEPDILLLNEYLESHLTEELTTEKVRQDLKFSFHQFYRLLKRNKVRSLPMHINRIRLEKGKRLLLETQKTIGEIGFEIGFKDAAYFTKVFKELTGRTPSEFRQGGEPPKTHVKR